MDPTERVGSLLYQGESIEESVEFEDNAVVVTSHRVLALTPDLDGPNYRHVDRPNVTGVRVETVGASRWLERTVQPLALGIVLLAGGWIVDLDGLTSGLENTETGGAGRAGIGGIVSMAESLGRALALLDEVLLIGGALSLLVVVLFLALYARSRTRQVTVVVAGEDDLTVPLEREHPDAVATLRGAVKS
jgi:hypothetical protein